MKYEVNSVDDRISFNDENSIIFTIFENAFYSK